MGNAAIGYINLADAGTVSASSQELQMPALKLLTPDVSDRFRSLSSAVFIVLDLLTPTLIDTATLRGITMTAGSTSRVRFSSNDSSGAAGDAYDSLAMTSGGSPFFDVNYGAICVVLPQPVLARFVRIDLSDPGRPYVEAGRLAVMCREQFTVNFDYGWQTQWVDRSVRMKSRGGQTLVWRDNMYRTISLTFAWVSPEQRYGLVEAVDRVNGLHNDVLMLPDTESRNYARDSIFGLVTDLTPVVQSVFEHFSKQYTVEERL